MTIPSPGQTAHLMTWCDVWRVRRKMRREEGRNVHELKLYTTDDLRKLYQRSSDDPIRLRDGIIKRNQLVAEILWRVFWDRWSYYLLLFVSVIGAFAALIAAIEGYR